MRWHSEDATSAWNTTPQRPQRPSPARAAAPPEIPLDDLDSDRWRRAIRVTVAHKWSRSRSLALAALTSAWLTFCSLLLLVDYPRWRVAAFVCVGLVGLVPYALGRYGRWSLPRWANEEYALTIFFLGSLFTGGIHSPVSVSALGPMTQNTQTGGIARPTLFRIAAFSFGLIVLAVAPASWVGPRPPPLVFAASLLAFLLPTIALQAQHSSLVADTLETMVRQVFRAREEVAARALARARELELLSSKLSHELKNPLGAVKALVQLSSRTAPDAETRERLAVVGSEVARMQSILHEYLSFSRPLEALRLERLQLGEVADEVLASLEGRAHAAGIRLDRRGDARGRADRRRLTEALLNLVANSIEATARDGRVSVEIEARHGKIDIVVRDTGSGMTAEVLARLGTPFFTTRAQGTGLGVLLARSVFTQHGGTLVFESTPGVGTEAIGSLPGDPEEGAGGA